MSSSRRKVITTRATSRLGATTALRKRVGKVDPAINDLIETDGSFFLGRLRQQQDIDKARNGRNLHVSDLLHTCLRMKAITVRTAQNRHNKYVNEGDGVTYAFGHAVQDYVIRRMKHSNPHELYGKWKCSCEATKITDVYANAIHTICSKCGTPAQHYNEVVIVNEEYGITGSIDATLKVNGAFYYTELKSIKDDAWKSLTRPQPDHLLQILFYYWLSISYGLPTHNRVSVVYCNKAYVFGSPLKEFSIDPRREYEERLTPLLEQAAIYKAAIDDPQAKLPARVCATPTSSVAKKCTMCSLCFALPE